MFTEHCLHAEKIEPARAGWSYIHCGGVVVHNVQQTAGVHTNSGRLLQCLVPANQSVCTLLWVAPSLRLQQCLPATLGVHTASGSPVPASLPPELEWRDLLAPDTNTHTHRLTWPAGQVGQGSSKWFLVESDICEDVLFSDLRGLTTTHYPLGGGPSLAASSELRARN